MHESGSHKEHEARALGVVSEALPNAMFRVVLDDGKEVLTYLAGRMRVHKIKVLIGDKVEIALDQYAERGRIVKRL